MTVARGTEALVRGDWQAAKDAFAGAGDSPDALAGLGEATFWLGDIAGAVEIRQRAYLAYRDHGDPAAAARMALWLAAEHSGALGNPAVGSGWLARAERLIDELGPCVELGWLLLRRSRSSVDPAAAEQLARDALALAHGHRDRDLEIAAISQQGRALLAAGRTAEGFACLDEAMAAATSGEVSSHATVSDTCCDMIVACERTMAIERATQWCQVTDDYARRINFLPLFAFCRVTYAGVLIAIGRWPDAERELGEALASYRASFGKPVLAVAKLAELRVLQGRDAEAEELVADHEHEPAAARVIAMLHLARGDADRAVQVLTRRLAAVAHDVLLAAPVLVLAVEAHLANGDRAAATAAADRLDAIARTSECQAFAAAASYAIGLVAADGDRLEHAIATYASIGMPLACARARLALARMLVDRDPSAAKNACRAAIASFEHLDARRDLDAAADLRRRLGVGAKVGRSASKLTKREQEVLALIGLGLPNAKIGARLFISPKTVEHHVSHILDKLGLETRAAAAAYVATHPIKPATK